MSEYGSVEQTRRRRKKHDGMACAVDCGCPPAIFKGCEHELEWMERNIKLLGLRRPHRSRIFDAEILKNEVSR